MMNDSFFGNSFGNSLGFGFTIVPILVIIVFIIVIGAFIIVFAKGIGEWNKNNHSPRLTVDATVVAKRANISHSSGTTITPPACIQAVTPAPPTM